MLIDCPDPDPDAILQIMFFRRHISVNSTIIRRSSYCYLMNGLNLMKRRRLGPYTWGGTTCLSLDLSYGPFH